MTVGLFWELHGVKCLANLVLFRIRYHFSRRREGRVERLVWDKGVMKMIVVYDWVWLTSPGRGLEELLRQPLLPLKLPRATNCMLNLHMDLTMSTECCLKLSYSTPSPWAGKDGTGEGMKLLVVAGEGMEVLVVAGEGIELLVVSGEGMELLVVAGEGMEVLVAGGVCLL